MPSSSMGSCSESESGLRSSKSKGDPEKFNNGPHVRDAATVSGIASAKNEKAQAEAISDARLSAQVQRIQTQILILSESLEKAVQTTDCSVTDSRLVDRASSRRSDTLSQTPANKLARLFDNSNGPNKPGRVNQQVPINVLTNPVNQHVSASSTSTSSSSSALQSLSLPSSSLPTSRPQPPPSVSLPSGSQPQPRPPVSSYGTLVSSVSPSNHLYSLISETEARTRYAFFNQSMTASFPLLALPIELYDYDQAFNASPLLVLACIYVTAICDRKFSNVNENRMLRDSLIEYLDRAVSHRVYIEAAGLSYHVVYACMILSLWGSPSSHVQQYKSQMDMISAYAVSLCIDAGNVSIINAPALPKENSPERNSLRTLLAVYCCCGWLNFSLPRFNFASWTPRHDLAIKILSRSSQQVQPSGTDRFLCFYSRFVRMGKQLFNFFSEGAVSLNLRESEEEPRGLAGPDPSDPFEHSLQLRKLVGELATYEAKLTDTVNEAGVLQGDGLSKLTVGERNCVLLIYYQLDMMVHDNLVSWCIYILTTDAGGRGQKKCFPKSDKDLLLHHIKKCGATAEKVLDFFIELNASHVSEFPTFFYYRALTSLASLIRLSIVVKSDISRLYFAEAQNFDFRLSSLYNEVVQIVEAYKVKFDSQVCQRLSPVLGRIGRWVHFIETHNWHLPAYQNTGMDFLRLTDMSIGQEIENLAAPKMPFNEASGNSPTNVRTSHANCETRPVEESFRANPYDIPDFVPPLAPNFSFQEMFKGIDDDIIRYLNPTETLDAGFSFTFD
ncbi:hypothetical protein JCM33374_g4172 [Metschnikowia sp. JCM 33374]|nr:hypothetical protein JCM33374_g4172 [Metschnikowia sp. JCM 33374]